MKTIYHYLKQENITLVNLLKYEGIIASGGEIKILFKENQVLYNNQLIKIKKKKIYDKDEIQINNKIKIKIIKV